MVADVDLVSLFRPTDRGLSSKTRSRIQAYRLLSVLGAVVIPLFGAVRHVTSPEAVDPLWARLALAALLAGLLAASYVSERVRHRYPTWGRRSLYLVMIWFVGVAAANGFTGNYDVGLLLLYALLLAIVGVGVRSMRPVLYFAGFGFALSSAAIVWGAGLRAGPPILILSMGTLAVLGSTAIQGGLSVQRKLADRERRLRTVTENVSDGIYRSVPGEGIVYANQAFAEMFGYDGVEEVLAADPAALYADPAERDRLRARAHEQGGLEGVEVELRRAGGATFTGLLSGTVVRTGEGEVRCYDGAVTDISPQKRRERQLRERGRLLRQIRENVTEVIWMSPADKSELEFISEAYEDVWGRPTEDPKEHPNAVVDAIHPEDRERVRAALSVQKENPEAYEETYRVVQPDGTVRWVRDRASGVYDEAGRLERIVGVATDITERRRLQERLLEVQAEERRRITQEIHGEMGGLLASLQMAVSVARMECEDDLTEQFGRIETLVNELSTAARTISRKLYPSDLSDYGLGEALSSLVRDLERRRALTIDLRSDLEPGDRFSSLLERTAYWVVQETLVNVARHAETDAAQVVARHTEGALRLRVVDEGVGFDPSRETEDDEFGLEGVRRRVERLRGEIEIDTEPGRGTRISVALPLGGAGAR